MVVGMFVTATLLAACGGGNGAPPEKTAETPAAEYAEQLVFDELGGDFASGRYERDGVALRFDIRPDRVGLYFVDGAVLFETVLTGAGPVVTALGEQVPPSPRALSSRGVAEAQSQAARAEAGPGDVHPEMKRLLTYPEARLLPYLSQRLGERGFNGSTVPVSLVFHLLAMSVAESAGVTDVGSQVPTLQAWTCPNGKYPVNAYNNSCFGTCGPGCTHWNWVCGETPGQPCARGGCVWHDYIGFYSDQTGNSYAYNDFWYGFWGAFDVGGGCSNNLTCSPLSDESFRCEYWDGNLTECDNHGFRDANKTNDTQDCAYYTTTNKCRARGTANAQAGMDWEYSSSNSETWACSTWDGNITECDNHGFRDANKANDTQDCAYYTSSNKCRERGTANCQAGVLGTIPW